MNIVSALLDNKIQSFEQAYRVKDITSPQMQNAIRVWFAMYLEGLPKEGEDDCQRLPVVIVNKLTKTVFSEYEAAVSTKGPKAEFMTRLLDRLDKPKKVAMQQTLVGGECFIKPILTTGGFDFSVVRRDCFIPLARDTHGRITDVGTSETTAYNGKYYTLLERRTVDNAGTLTIQSKLYESNDPSLGGSQVALSAIPKYAALQPELALQGVGNIGMACVKTPLLNCVDMSQDGVSVYAPALGLIRNINRNEHQLNGEFERGESRIIVSGDMMEMNEDGGRKRLSAHVFTAVDESPDDIGVNIFSPALREASYLARKQEYLRNIESQIGLKRGILSEVEAAERTATEITSSAGDYNLTIIDFQSMWEDALRELLGICDKIGQIYKLCDSTKFDTEKDITVDWGDGVLFNRDKAWTELSGMVASSMIKPEIAIAWYYNLTFPETPKDLEVIRAKYMPEIEALTGGAGDE
ncbi:phage portal protein [Oscillibacter sp.]|uniref:phage portal protein n=1 Tax=Oscillibacter sp. TaxID=1945593 RepID=UPI00289DBFF5|nr:phage portal protein [Oscillibacter sp.]